MLGLINRSIQSFVTYAYGAEAWAKVTRKAGLGFTHFEAMMRYDKDLTPRLLDAASAVLEQSRTEMMEDIGSFIVSHHSFEAVRRLLRFGGIDFVDFLHSLDDLDERVRLAVPDLHLPAVELLSHRDGNYSLLCDASIPGFGHVMLGLLQTMAEDYGALALCEHTGTHNGKEIISIQVIECEFTEGRTFELRAQA